MPGCGAYATKFLFRPAPGPQIVSIPAEIAAAPGGGLGLPAADYRRAHGAAGAGVIRF